MSKSIEAVIVTRHAGLVEWLNLRGIYAPVITHVEKDEEIVGKVVYGVLPLNLAAIAEMVISVDLPNLKPEQRGKDITPAEMDAAGATLSMYRVTKEIVPSSDDGDVSDKTKPLCEVTGGGSCMPCALDEFRVYGIDSDKDWFVESGDHEICGGRRIAYHCMNYYATAIPTYEVRKKLPNALKYLTDEEIYKIQMKLVDVLKVGHCGMCS